MNNFQSIFLDTIAFNNILQIPRYKFIFRWSLLEMKVLQIITIRVISFGYWILSCVVDSNQSTRLAFDMRLKDGFQDINTIRSVCDVASKVFTLENVRLLCYNSSLVSIHFAFSRKIPFC